MSDLNDLLECAREAIVDAICSENGLDGVTGEQIIWWLTSYIGDEESFRESHSELIGDGS